MLRKLALVKNVQRLREAFTALKTRDPAVPGMGLVHGFTGSGKTTSIAWLVNQERGIYVRAFSTWTPLAMLGDIMLELGAAPLGRCAAMVQHIVGELRRNGRPLFVDEADYLLQDNRMIETLRDLHDASSAPVVLIGMEGIERKLVHRLQLARRISHWVEFQKADLEDAGVLAETTCEMGVCEDLLQRLHAQAGGSMGLMVVGLSRIESFARAEGLARVSLAQWGKEAFFLPRPSASAGR